MRNVLRIVETEQTPPRAHQLLQELRDLSSMAMEHFDEHILPRIKEQIERRTGNLFFFMQRPLSKFLLHLLLPGNFYN